MLSAYIETNDQDDFDISVNLATQIDSVWFKIPEAVSQLLKGASLATSSIKLISEKAVCPSCTSVIEQFRLKYPKVQLNLFTVE
ncbi:MULTISPECIES: deaminase domain-containing protein [Pseudomonas syringae group]|uniref:deaminase domain-containing protein n=1 Tax=Pseudomonas syringae group TaxID=136849 RepID=UPI0009C05E2E|nr:MULTISPECIES: deaminase domain-containing protein [Pseudomonas syringae group]